MTAQDRYMARMEKRKALGRALNVILSNQPELYTPKAGAEGKQKQGGSMACAKKPVKGKKTGKK